MKLFRNKWSLILVLVAVSAALFVLQAVIFHEEKETAYLTLQDLAFMPIDVILVTFILDKIITIREKQEKLERLNILINDFFNEAGREILVELNRYVKNLPEISDVAGISAKWKDEDFTAAARAMEKIAVEPDMNAGDLTALRNFMQDKKKHMLAMVENPSLLEHDRFTEMLWAVYHLADELKAREDLSALPTSDLSHLGGDLKRAYRFLCIEWIYFNQYIKKRYPYLFSLALRRNPFRPGSVLVLE